MKKIDINKIASRIVNASNDEQQYCDKTSDLFEKIQKHVIDYVVNNFGSVQEDGYIITFVDWNFEIQCNGQDIDENKVRELIRTGEANKAYEDCLYNSEFQSELNELSDMAIKIYELDEDDYNDVDELNSILQNCDFLPGQEVSIYNDGEYVKDIPWTRNMWGGGAWG